MGEVLILALTSSLNPTLVAATTVMLLLPRPVKLMTGYLLGALMTSITLGLVIIFSLPTSGLTGTTRHTLSPGVDIGLGLIAVVMALVLRSGRDQRVRDRRHERKAAKPDKGPPRWQRALQKGSARTTFAVGALLTLPGASYLAGLSALHKLKYTPAVTVLVVLGFNLIMLWLLEVPLAAFLIAPDATPDRLARAKAWVSRHARKFAVRGLGAIGLLLIIKGIIGLT